VRLCPRQPIHSLAADESLAEVEVAEWSLVFESESPAVVRRVLADGRVAAWNATREHCEDLLRPGDELLWLSLAGLRETLKYQSLGSALHQACVRFCASSRNDEEGASGPIELVFRALRALSPLRIEHELELMRSSGCEVVARAATTQTLRALIASCDCRALHLSLHCSVVQEHLLFLEDPHGRAHLVRSGELRTFLTQGQQGQCISLVFLNACHSLALGTHFVDAGVRHVVCVRNEDEVRDASCQLFARDFWAALQAGRTVKEAFDCGKAVLTWSQESHMSHDAQSFVLLPEGADHDERFAPASGAMLGPPLLSPPGGSWGSLSPAVEDFVGREVDVYRLLELVSRRRFVQVKGDRGVGKSAVLAEAGRFLLFRREAFEEVRYVAGSARDEVSEELVSGLGNLLQRLVASPQRRVLLIIDDPNPEVWIRVQAVLQFGKVHVVHSLSGDAVSRPARSAVDAGLKPAVFCIGPLDPVTQVQLFLCRAPRPLRAWELGKGQGAVALSGGNGVVKPPQKPADFMRLAETPLFRGLGGSPRRIVDAAVQLGTAFQARSLSGDESAGPCNSVQQPPSSRLGPQRSGRRRVRLVRPDGKVKDEWLPAGASLADVLVGHCPKTLRGAADIFIGGCRAPSEATLTDFHDNVELGLLVLEFHPRDHEDDW